MVFACNPVYRHIAYFREIVLGGTVPSWETHLALAGFAAVALLVGMFMYKRYNTRFLCLLGGIRKEERLKPRPD